MLEFGVDFLLEGLIFLLLCNVDQLELLETASLDYQLVDVRPTAGNDVLDNRRCHQRLFDGLGIDQRNSR